MRLKEDNTSWRSGGIKRRDFRHDPGLPETEIPKQTGLKRNKKKHVHNYVQRWVGKVVGVHFCTINGVRQRIEREMDKFAYVCEGCGNKKSHYYGGYYYR